MTYFRSCDGDRKLLNTPAKNIHSTKGYKKKKTSTVNCKSLRGFNALTTTLENQNNYVCCQRYDESLSFGWQLCNIALFVLTVNDVVTFVWFDVGVPQSLVALM